MKVKIKKYSTWLGPYQLVEKLCFWAKDVEDEYGIKDKPQWVFNIGDWLAHTWFGGVWSRVAQGWVSYHDKRRVKVHIDRWDTWNMDSTLAHIVLPMLIQLRAEKHGSPLVDDEDVPHLPKQQWSSNENIQMDMFASDEQDKLFWDQYEVRWNWVMDEMIFAFESKRSDDWKDQFYSGEHDRITVPVDKDGNEVPEEEAVMYEWRKGSNDTFNVDMEGYKAYQDRISNGFRLFGKYFENLWT